MRCFRFRPSVAGGERLLRLLDRLLRRGLDLCAVRNSGGRVDDHILAASSPVGI